MLGIAASSGIPVVTNGLALWYDAAQTRSYGGTGTTWKDLISGYDATMNGTFTFYPNVFNGIYFSDFSPFSSVFNINSAASYTGLSGLTMQVVIMYTEGQYDNAGLFTSSNSGGNTFGLTTTAPSNITMVSDGGGRSASATLTQNVWNFVSGVRDTSTLSMSIRINNTSRITNTYGSLGTVNFTNAWMINRNSNGSSVQLRGRIGTALFYTRALTPDEELQNFNVFKNRFSIGII
jgi:hypothetical protein